MLVGLLVTLVSKHKLRGVLLMAIACTLVVGTYLRWTNMLDYDIPPTTIP